VQVEQATLRRGPSEDDPPLALVRRGTQGTVKKCAHDWCQMDFGAAKGWVNIKTLWGVEVGSTPPAEDGDTEKDPVN
jgi:SH3-like domain-containing protein